MIDMESPSNIAVIVVAAGGGIATFFCARQALSRNNVMGSPGIIAACVAGLSFYGMTTMGPFLVMGFTALGCTCLLLPFVLYVIHHWPLDGTRGTDEEPPRRGRRVIPASIESLISRASPPPPPAEPEIPAQQPPSTPASKMPASSSKVIPLILRRSTGASRNSKKPPSEK